tara:strand:- start:1128 stop:1598 length:471 start_codon:yes stop_codon:yes gene_type:complete
MNIFYINEDPIVAAKELADDHIRKMQIESAQMCSTAHWETGGEAPYKRAHKNHPSTLWTRRSIQHYDWLIKHGLEICSEFIKRYGKHHKTQDVLEWLRDNKPNIADNGFTPPPQCMPDVYKKSNTIEAYKDFYINDKVAIKKLSWNKLNNKPSWVI